MRLRIALLLSLLSVAVLGCEGVDVSQLSDDDLDRISERLITCEDPYIRHGSDCCLDQDKNKICDDDEQEPKNLQEDSVKEEPVNPPKEKTGADEEEEQEETSTFTPPTSLLMCEGSEHLDLGMVPAMTSATICEGNSIIFGFTRLSVESVSPGESVIEYDGESARLGETERHLFQGEEGQLEVWFQYDSGDQIQLTIDRVTNPQGYNDKPSNVRKIQQASNQAEE